MTWVGWVRITPNGRWQKATSGRTWVAAWDALVAIHLAVPSIEKIVLATGRHPNGTKVRR